MYWFVPLCLMFAPATTSSAQDAIEVEHALVTLIEQVEVPAREAGILSTVDVREGQLVAPGDVLAQLDDTQSQLAKNRAQIDLDIARAEAENDVDVRFAKKSTEVTRAELKRATESQVKYNRSISATEIDRLRLEAERAVLEVEQAEQKLTIAKFTEKLKQNDVDFATWTLDRLRIKSPLAGMVVEVKQRAGEWVEPGETMFRVVRIDRLRVEAFLDARDADETVVGRAVTLSLTQPGRASAEFTGKMVFVSPEVDPVNGQVRAWAEVENRGTLLRPGLHGSLRIAPLAADAPRPNAVN